MISLISFGKNLPVKLSTNSKRPSAFVKGWIDMIEMSKNNSSVTRTLESK